MIVCTNTSHDLGRSWMTCYHIVCVNTSWFDSILEQPVEFV
jgi:hypothetical protein